MKKILLFILSVHSYIQSDWFNEIKNFNLTSDPIDVLIACHEKDEDILQICIRNAKAFVKNVRRIIVVSEKSFSSEAEWFDESLFPFSKESIKKEFSLIDDSFYLIPAKEKRVGWYFKQIMNFYAAFIIPNISNNILILDADTVFLKPVEFVDDSGIMLHAPGTEHHFPYFEHMNKFLPGLKRVMRNYSGISHHMLFQRQILEDLFNLVESFHSMPFWQAYCRCVNRKDIEGAGSADYEVYFNFVLMRTKQYKIRPLNWLNINRLSLIGHYQKQGLDFVSCHHYSRLD